MSRRAIVGEQLDLFRNRPKKRKPVQRKVLEKEKHPKYFRDLVALKDRVHFFELQLSDHKLMESDPRYCREIEEELSTLREKLTHYSRVFQAAQAQFSEQFKIELVNLERAKKVERLREVNLRLKKLGKGYLPSRDSFFERKKLREESSSLNKELAPAPPTSRISVILKRGEKEVTAFKNQDSFSARMLEQFEQQLLRQHPQNTPSEQLFRAMSRLAYVRTAKKWFKQKIS